MRIREESPQRARIDLLYDPAIPFLGTYPKDSISYYRATCSPMFTAAIFTIPRKWKAAWMPINRQMDNENVTHMHNGILFGCK